MADSLRRIRTQPQAVWRVKLADRIVNLAAPPHDWKTEKNTAYRAEAVTIADAPGDASPCLHARLRARVEVYPPPKFEGVSAMQCPSADARFEVVVECARREARLDQRPALWSDPLHVAAPVRSRRCVAHKPT